MLRRRTLAAALASALLALLATEPALAQVDGESVTPGASCPAGAVTGKADKADWDTFFECNASNQSVTDRSAACGNDDRNRRDLRRLERAL